MKTYADKEKVVVKRRECTRMVCDSCGREAEHPEQEAFEWGGQGIAIGKLSWYWSMDGEDCRDDLDLCYECAEQIANHITSGAFKRTETICPDGEIAIENL